MPMFEWTPPTTSQSFAELVTTAKMGRKILGGRRDIFDLQFLFSTSATQYLDTWFESDHVKGAFGWHAINDSVVRAVDARDCLRAPSRPRLGGVRRRRPHLGLRPRAAWAR